jgi:hypothetical protein
MKYIGVKDDAKPAESPFNEKTLLFCQEGLELRQKIIAGPLK